MISLSWMEHGRCQGTSVDMVPTETRGQEVITAKRVCRGCPVRTQCLAYTARVHAEERLKLVGVWGGLTQEERDRVRAGVAERTCEKCGLGFVAARKIPHCDSCRRRRGIKEVEQHADTIRRMVAEEGKTATDAAHTLGLDRTAVSAWCKKNIKAERPKRKPKQKKAPRVPVREKTPRAPAREKASRAPVRTAAPARKRTPRAPVKPVKSSAPKPPRERAPCGTELAKIWHRKQMRKQGLPGSVKGLSCACGDMQRDLVNQLKPCGTAAAAARHRRELKAAGLPGVLDHLTCACATPPKTPSQNLRWGTSLVPRKNVDATGIAGQGMAV